MLAVSAAKNWIALGVPLLCVTGCLMHFAYQWSGHSVVVGAFAPVNESVWEHLKLTFWPMLAWWCIGYRTLNKRGTGKVSAATWFASCAAAELTCPLVIVTFYYTYTGAFGIESLILDIVSLVLGVAVAQMLALHVFEHTKGAHGRLWCALAVLVLLATAFTAFTFNAPHIPLFRDSQSGQYGYQRP